MPKLLKLDIVSSIAVEPTVIAVGSEAGEELEASVYCGVSIVFKMEV